MGIREKGGKETSEGCFPLWVAYRSGGGRVAIPSKKLNLNYAYRMKSARIFRQIRVLLHFVDI